MKLLVPFLATLALSSLPQALGSERVWVVDFFGGPGVDFLEIQAAVDAAADGDTILVREGTYYEGFEIVDKALVVAAHPPGAVRFAYDDGDRIRVADLPLSKTVELHGLGTDESSFSAPRLVLENNLGVVWVEECRFAADEYLSYPYTESVGVRLTASEDVVFLGCDITGYPAIRATDSSFHMFDSRVLTLESLFATEEGVPGIELVNSFVFLSGSSVTGGWRDPLDVISGPVCIGDGGAGVELSDGSELNLQDSVLTGGFVDPGALFICALFGYTGTVGTTGPPFAVDGTSTVNDLSGIAHAYDVTPVVREGEILERTFQGAPGEGVFLVQADGPLVFFDALLTGTVLIGSMDATTTFIGSLDGTGTLQLTETLADLGPGVSFAVLYEQGFFWDVGGSGSTFVGGGASTLLLDASFSGPVGRDCNQNGFDDDEDLAAGRSLDCNRNGTPDECERFTPVQLDKLVAPDGANQDAFGFSMALDGDTLVIGAPQDEGATSADLGSTYVFERQGDSWTQVQKLRAANLQGVLRFGHSVDLEGDVLVIGAPDSFIVRSVFQRIGNVYVFERAGGVWTQTAKLDTWPLRSNGFSVTEMGLEVTIEDGTIAIGGNNDPVVVLYEKVGGVWQEVQALTEFGGFCCSTGYGSAIEMQDETLLIGAPGRIDSDGSVLVYERVAGTWQHTDTLVPPVPGTEERFGSRIAIADDTVFVTAIHRDRAARNSGVAYAFRRLLDGTFDLGATVKLAPLEGFRSGEFGNSIAATADHVLVCQFDDATVETGGPEATHVFQRDALGDWERYQRTSFVPRDWVSNDNFGSSLVLDGSQVLIGASLRDVGVQQRGAVYVFDLADLIVPNPCLRYGPRSVKRVDGPVPRGR